MSESKAKSTSTPRKRGICFVLSAPSGAGKSTIANALRATQPNLFPSISVTTRDPRPGEEHGVHYHFISQEEFEKQAENDELLEWATVFGRGYGTPRAPVEKLLSEGKDLIFDIDWQGHQQIRKALPHDVVGIFILPPSLNELKNRLQLRGSDHIDEINNRMNKAMDEISHWNEFDYVIINHQLNKAIEKIESILASERLKTDRQLFLDPFIQNFQHER